VIVVCAIEDETSLATRGRQKAIAFSNKHFSLEFEGKISIVSLFKIAFLSTKNKMLKFLIFWLGQIFLVVLLSVAQSVPDQTVYCGGNEMFIPSMTMAYDCI
jgi:hypothetical protein